MHAIVVTYVTVPQNEAQELATALVERGHAACVNIVPSVQSVYRWNNKVEQSTESLLIIKTQKESFERLRLAVVDLHSYDVPEVISIPVSDGHQPYLEWVCQSSQPVGEDT